MNTRNKIKKLKRRAKKLNRVYYKALNEFSCGAALAEYINPDIMKLRVEFNKVWKELSELDPECPKLFL